MAYYPIVVLELIERIKCVCTEAMCNVCCAGKSIAECVICILYMVYELLGCCVQHDAEQNASPVLTATAFGYAMDSCLQQSCLPKSVF